MNKLNISINYKIAKFINFILNSKLNIFLIFNLLNIFIYAIMKNIQYFFFLEILIIIFCFSTKRVSKVLVYQSIFHIVSMNLEDVNMFKNYNYKIQKDKISESFKEELIDGLLKINSKYIKFQTHKFVVERF